MGFQSKTLAELEDIFTETTEAQELASGIGDAAKARQWLRTKLQAVGEKAGFPAVLGEVLGGREPLPTCPLAHSCFQGVQTVLAWQLHFSQFSVPCRSIPWDIFKSMGLRLFGGLWGQKKGAHWRPGGA